MKTLKGWISFVSLSVIFCSTSLSATYKVETINSQPEGVSKPLSTILQPGGSQILDEKGASWCDVWLRKEIPDIGKPGSPDAKYQSLHIGQLIGILKFEGTGSDFRGQTIKPGTYTMRYCLIPQDGNHMGVSPIPDFVLLIPAADDTQDPDAMMTMMDVVALSRKASGTNHPATILLSPPPEGSYTSPSLEKDDMGYWVLKLKSQTKADTELPIGIIVVGRAEG